MDEDCSGTVDRLEWLAYLSSKGKGDGKDKDYYDFKLRAMFEKADSGKHANLTLKQLNDFVKMDLKNLLSEIPHEEDRQTLEPELTRFSRDVFKMLMGRDPIGMRDTISWVQFKNYRSVCQKRIEMIKREITLFTIEVKTELTKSILKTSHDGSI